MGRMNRNDQREIFPARLQEAPWISIGAVLVFDLLSPLLLFFPVHPLVIVLLPWLFVIGVGIFLLGKLHFSDLGISAAKIPPAILYGLGIWAIIQLVVATVLFFLKGQFTWGEISPGYLIDQLFFFAFAEEIIFRGFLFPQLYLKWNRTDRYSQKAFWGALFVSQAIFSLYHIPHLLLNNTPIQELPFQLLLLWISGMFLCYIYLRSKNLLVSVAVHALGNAPAILFSYDVLPWYVVNLIVMGTAITWIEVGRLLPSRKPQAR